MRDLFGVEVTEEQYLAGPRKISRLGPRQQTKLELRYRPREDEAVCCGTCRHHSVQVTGRRYHKCALIGVTASATTDIRVRHVCDGWEALDAR